MSTSKRIIEVAGQQATHIHERYPGYRRDLVQRLVDIVAKQGEGLSNRLRRERISEIIDAFGAKVAAQQQEDAP